MATQGVVEVTILTTDQCGGIADTCSKNFNWGH